MAGTTDKACGPNTKGVVRRVTGRLTVLVHPDLLKMINMRLMRSFALCCLLRLAVTRIRRILVAGVAVTRSFYCPVYVQCPVRAGIE
jgi:hypothetical protein